MSDELVAVGTPIDLDNCDREPIHIPGSIQPRGVLAVVAEPDFAVRQISANVETVLGRTAGAVLGQHLKALVGSQQAAHIEQAASAFGDLRQRNPVECVIEVDGDYRAFDAILSRGDDGVLIVELEVAYGARPFAFPNTYQAVRDSVEALNRATTLSELFDTTARAVRDLTGFDRVMVYRYDDDYNGEVVAEARRDDLAPLLGLHYPASDIPAQARALYEKSWLRLIDDVAYTPAPLLPPTDPVTGEHTDLTYASLRSVSPIHVEYLQNMGVRASMSISLLRGGTLWGLIACHHYCGPHRPPYGTRAAAEFLGSTLSLRLVDQFEDAALRSRLAAQGVLTSLTAATVDDRMPLTSALLGDPSVLDLVPADGVVLDIGGERREHGVVPPPRTDAALARWAAGAVDGVSTSRCLSVDVPDAGVDPLDAAGALRITLPDGQHVTWFRREVVTSVDWGGDPHDKVVVVEADAAVRLGPRRSFDRWRETVAGHGSPWTPTEVETAGALRHQLVESLYHRARSALRVAEMLQRSLMPETLPTVPGWNLSAHYEPAAGYRVGGDWYDAFTLRDGRLILVLGDVAGHGVAAAGTMAQLRNVLRAQLFSGSTPAEALTALNDFAVGMLPGAFATVLTTRVDLATGHVEAASAGHLMPLVTTAPDAPPAAAAPLRQSPPLGFRGMTYRQTEIDIDPGTGLVLFSDGLVERRDSTIDDGLARLAALLGDVGDSNATDLWRTLAAGHVDDDVTVVSVYRPAR